jgi:uncharacterized membrane protein YphA (DoxX/SURF4 family)
VTAAAVAGFVLGAVLLASGALKLAAGPRWAAQAEAMGAPAATVPAVPWFELALGALLMAGVARPAVALLAAAMLVVFTVVLVLRLAEGRRVPCACFGGRSAKPIGIGSVVRNLVLIALALVAAFS